MRITSVVPSYCPPPASQYDVCDGRNAPPRLLRPGDFNGMVGGELAIALQDVSCCPVCDEPVRGQHGLDCHFGRSESCRDAQPAAPTPMEEDGCAVLDLAEIYADSVKTEVGEDLAEWRYSKYIPATTVDAFKTKVCGWLYKATDELVRRLAGRRMEADDLRQVVRSVLDLFSGIETEKREAAELRARVPLADPVYRELGRRAVRSVDAEGVESGPVRIIVDFCYDVPVTCSLARLLQYDPRAWQMVQNTMETWSRAP